MRGVPGPGQEDERLAGAAPIQHFELNTWFHGDHLNLMRCWIRLGAAKRSKPKQSAE
jgi:hypothetical protein